MTSSRFHAHFCIAVIPHQLSQWIRFMRNAFIAVIILLSHGHAQEILQITSFDGVTFDGNLRMPRAGFQNTIVIDVPSSGPHTYDDRRKVGRNLIFNYHDYFANEFTNRGIAYFSYNTRYTVADTMPPYFDRVEKENFFAYTPSMKVKDLEEVIAFLKKDNRLASSKIILLGWSEGTILASLVAERNIVPIDALFLAGAPSEDVYTTILWQHSGAASLINFRKFFDANKDSIIQRDEYENAEPRAITKMGGKKFDELDVNHDSVLTTEDFRIILKPRLQQILSAIEKHDDEWIWNSFFRVGARWIEAHRMIEPNSTRLMKLDLPVYLFHGTHDANCPVEGILRMQKLAAEKNKSNIHVFIFPEHDHTLEFLTSVVQRSMSDGVQAIYHEVEKFLQR